VLLINIGGNSIYVLFWSSAPILLPIGKAKKGALYGQKNEFFKSNMDALIVLSIWDTVYKK